jgi:hypothetical protein
MTPEPTTWVTIESTTDGMAIRAVVLLLIALTSVVLGIAFRDGITAYFRGFGRAFARALGREAPPEWLVTEWLCGACRSVNVRAASRCSRCKASRAENEVHATAPEMATDVIPTAIDGTARRVTLEHNGAAHRDPGGGHWRLRIDGRVTGSAALRDGALALLRVVHGTDTVLFDAHGSGVAAFRLGELISAFEGPALPLKVPCPEGLVRSR